MQRADGRSTDQSRPVSFQADIAPNATGSVLVATGNTRVICTASVADEVPRWMQQQGVPGGWLTAEYAMLPGATPDRKPREISRGRPDSRNTEIQRLIGRSLRAATDLVALGPRTVWIDCDVLQADGGTRTAAVTGASVAAAIACERLVRAGQLPRSPVRQLVAGISAGIVGGTPLLDLDYGEDRAAAVDCNLVFTEDFRLAEVQATAEEGTFSEADLGILIALGRAGVATLFRAQRAAVEAAVPAPSASVPPGPTSGGGGGTGAAVSPR